MNWIQEQGIVEQPGKMKYTKEDKGRIIAKIAELCATGLPAYKACLQVGISDFNYRNWSGLVKRPKSQRSHKDDEVIEIVHTTGSKEKQSKLLEIENRRLKMIIADLMLDKQALIEYQSREEQ